MAEMNRAAAETEEWRPRGCRRGEVLAVISLWSLCCWQALAYSRLALATPMAGLVTAILGACIYPLLNGGRAILMGPSGVICAIIGATMAEVPNARAAASLALLALMAAGFSLLAGCLRLACLPRLFPEPVWVGYLAGAGITVAVAQMAELALHGLPSFGVGVASIALSLILPRLGVRASAPLIVLALATASSAFLDFERRGVRVIGSALGRLAPAPLSVELDGQTLAALIAAALSVALIASVHPLRVGDSFSSRGDAAVGSSRECFVLAAVNVAAGLCGGIAAGYSSSQRGVVMGAEPEGRRATVLAGVLLIVSLPLSGFVSRLPLAAISGVLVVAALGWVDVQRMSELSRRTRHDYRIALVTAFGVTSCGLRWGVAIGVAAALCAAFRSARSARRDVLAPGLNDRQYRAFDHKARPVPARGAPSRWRRHHLYRWVGACWPPRREPWRRRSHRRAHSTA